MLIPPLFYRIGAATGASSGVRWKRHVGLLCLLVLLSPTLVAQLSPAGDSVLQKLNQTGQTEERVDLLNQAARSRLRTDPAEAGVYAQEALELSQELSYTEGKARAQSNLGNIRLQRGEYDSAKVYFESGLAALENIGDQKGVAQLLSDLSTFYIVTAQYDLSLEASHRVARISEQLEDKKGMAAAYNRIGIVYDYQGNYLPAIENYQKALKLNEEIDHKMGMAACYSNLGIIYDFLEDYDQALEYANKSLQLLHVTGDSMALTSSYNNLGILHKKVGNDSLSLHFYQESIALSERLGRKRTVAMAKSNLAQYYQDKGDMDQAWTYYQDGRALYETMGDSSGLTNCLIGIAEINLERGNFKTALQQSEAIWEWALRVDEKSAQKQLAELRAKAFEGLGKYAQAYDSHVLFKEISDSLLNAESIRESSENAFQVAYEKEKALEEMQHLQEDALKQTELERERLWKYFFIGGFAVLMVFVGLVFWGYFNLRRTNQTISRQKDEILYLNQNLEQIVAQRTEELAQQNQRLSTYIYTNSHRVRGPIARILGLMQLHRTNGFQSQEEQERLFEYIERSAQEADRVVYEIAEGLEGDKIEGQNT